MVVHGVLGESFVDWNTNVGYKASRLDYADRV